VFVLAYIPIFSPAFVVCVLDDTILTGVRWNLNFDLICISFYMAKDAEYFFMYLLAICTFFFLVVPGLNSGPQAG
jgi:hypothetical protein